MGMRVIALQLEILVLEVEDALHIGIDVHDGQFARFTGELQTCLVKVVQIQVGVARGMNELTGLQTCHLCHHLEQERIGGDVEGYPQEGVGRTLVEL